MVSSSRSTLLVLIFKSPGWLSRQGTLFYQLPFEPGHLFINLTSSICLITLMPNDDCSSKDLLFLLEEIWAYLSGSKYFADLVINVCLDKFSLRKGVWVINESILTFFFKSADIFFWFKWSKSYSALSGNSQPDLLRRQHRSHRPFLPPPTVPSLWLLFVLLPRRKAFPRDLWVCLPPWVTPLQTMLPSVLSIYLPILSMKHELWSQRCPWARSEVRSSAAGPVDCTDALGT